MKVCLRVNGIFDSVSLSPEPEALEIYNFSAAHRIWGNLGDDEDLYNDPGLGEGRCWRGERRLGYFRQFESKRQSKGCSLGGRLITSSFEV